VVVIDHFFLLFFLAPPFLMVFEDFCFKALLDDLLLLVDDFLLLEAPDFLLAAAPDYLLEVPAAAPSSPAAL